MIRKKERRHDAPGPDLVPEVGAASAAGAAAGDASVTHPAGDASASFAAPAAPAAPGDPASLLADLERARTREDDLMRAVAELTNVNRRRRQDMETSVLYAQESLIRGLLPVLDDIDRALEASKSRADDPVRAGVLLIRDRLWRTLEKEGLEAIRPAGERFDPELHDAMAQRATAESPPDTVLEVTLPGYRLKGRVLRHAQVIVAAPRTEGDEQ